jgi:hypothetical protein
MPRLAEHTKTTCVPNTIRVSTACIIEENAMIGALFQKDTLLTIVFAHIVICRR